MSTKKDLYKNIAELLIFLCIVALCFAIYQGISCVGLSQQSLANIRFVYTNLSAQYSSIIPLLKTYSGAQPPLYSTALLVLALAGIPIEIANFLFFCMILLLIIALFKTYIKNIHWIFPVLLYVSATFNWYNMKQYTPETLSIAINLVVFLFLLRYLKDKKLSDLIILSIAAAFSFLTRYFALYWMLPVIIFKVSMTNIGNIKRALKHIAIFLSISLPVIGVWMCGVYAVTGHLTGMDRMGIKLQLHKPYIVDISRFPGFTDLKHNLLFTLKTIFIDFCSPFKVAIHTVVNYAYSLSVQEYIIFFLITCMLLSVFLFRKKTAVGHDMAKNKHPYGALTNLLFQLFIIYIFVTIFLWTIGNNDPIYTRFLYPSYLFLMLSVFSYYSYIKNDLTSFYQKIPFYTLYLSILLINSYKTLMLSLRTDIIPHW